MTDIHSTSQTIYQFGDFTLDTKKSELSFQGRLVPLERQVLLLLRYLVENRDRLVTREDLVASVWQGRVVSDSAISSRIKTLRKALQDDGTTQHTIKTVYGQGFRFVADILPGERHGAPIEVAASGGTGQIDAPVEAGGQLVKPSIAILPFRLVGYSEQFNTMAEAIPQDLISSISRLQWLRVIARGSSFRFRSGEHDLAEIASALDIRYCLSGILEVSGNYIAITIELEDAREMCVVWSESLKGAAENVHDFREEIVSNIVSNLEMQISLNEARLARVATPDRLDAWSMYHLGLQHLHRFNREDNFRAEELFSRVRSMAPDFARGHAAMSGAHFQNALLRYRENQQEEIARASELAQLAIDLDPLDPFANFAKGRSHVLYEDLEGAKAWLDRAIDLSPNYAQGNYSRAWAGALSGSPEEAIRYSDNAISLSPLDPLLYAMYGTKGFANMILGDMDAAVQWAERAVRAPGAHVLIVAMAMLMNILKGDDKQARYWLENIRAQGVTMTSEFFLRAFPFQDQGVRKQVRDAFALYGM